MRLRNKTVRVNVHFSEKLIAAIDAYAEELTRDDPAGRSHTRADAMRALLLAGLAARGEEGAAPTPEAYEGAPGAGGGTR